MGAKAVAVSGFDAGNMAMNHRACALRQNKSGLALALKQAKFDSRGVNGKYSDIDAGFIQRRAKGFGKACRDGVVHEAVFCSCPILPERGGVHVRL